jgi:hypothetical protein
MQILATSRMVVLLVMGASAPALVAQSAQRSPGQPPDHTSALDARQIAGESVAATERSWQARRHYTYTERDQERRLDAHGQVNRKMSMSPE